MKPRQNALKQKRHLLGIMTILALLSVLITTVVLPGSHAHAQTTGPMGTNVDSVTDYSPTFLFTDVIKQGRQWGDPAQPWASAVPVDSNGWPTTDAGIILITLGDLFTGHVDGIYKLSFQGQATIANADGTIANQTYDSTTNTTTADVIVQANDTNLRLTFTNTRRTSSSATNTGITNVKCIRPGYPADGSQLFTTAFLNSLSLFQSFRTMDLTQTNNSSIVNWSDRPHTSDALQTTQKGVAWEYLIQLANQANKDIWINIPHQATDDYVTQLATLFKNNLNANLNVYVEYSNEVWNGGFGQTGWNQAQAANDASLKWDGASDPSQLGARRVAKRIVQISTIFKNVWGSSAINTHVRPVLAWQVGNTYDLQDQLNTIQHLFGTPNQYIYALSTAPYMHEGDGNGVSDDTSSVDAIINGLYADSDNNRSKMQDVTTLAHNNGLKHLAYEGGTHTPGANNLDNRIAANRDARMKDLLIHDIGTNWFGTGGDMYVYYTDFTPYTQYGEWGLSESVFDTNSPKWQAIQQLATSGGASTPTPTNTPTPLPGGSTTSYEAESSANTLAGGAQVVSCSFCSGGNRVGYLGYAGTLQFNNVSGGSGGAATLTVYYVNGDVTRTATMSINGAAGSSVSFPNTGNWDTLGSVSVNVTLQAGNNTIKFSNASGYLPDYDRITVTTSGSATPTPTPSPSPTPAPGGWTFCANENGTCTFAGTQQVRYGANGTYAYQTATGSIACNNTTFGDPLPGVVKHCDVSSGGSTPTPTPSPTPSPGGLPSPWQTQDVGAVGVAGSASYASSTFTLNGSGSDVWGNVDQFRFVYQSVTGDSTIIANVTGLTNTDPWSYAGLMLRESTATGAKNAFVSLTPGNGAGMSWRDTTDGSSGWAQGPGVAAPYWIKLVRSGNTFTGSISSDGTSWTQVSSQTFSMNSTLLIGQVVCSHNNGALATGTFSQVSVSQP